MLGLYIHIPFCRSKCLYCDFCSYPRRDEALMARYCDALCRDLRARASECVGEVVDTVYFGGGTPTVLPVFLLCGILKTVFEHYSISPDAEITAECNPATGGVSYFSEMRKCGFNRLSIGLQSAHANELRALGRLHGFDSFVRTFREAREAGFDNISADLMSGIPEQTVESYLASVEALARLSPEHISAYGLTVEEGTPFGRMGERLVLPDEECAREMYFAGLNALESHGYKQYEISNFAKEGYRSRHNMKYWRCEPYLGFGPAAYSDFGGARFGNSRDLIAYIDGNSIECERETPDAAERMNEALMLGLRLSDGVDAEEFACRFGVGFDARYGARLSEYSSLGLAARTERGWRLTPEGFYVSNTILSDLLALS